MRIVIVVNIVFPHVVLRLGRIMHYAPPVKPHAAIQEAIFCDIDRATDHCDSYKRCIPRVVLQLGRILNASRFVHISPVVLPFCRTDISIKNFIFSQFMMYLKQTKKTKKQLRYNLSDVIWLVERDFFPFIIGDKRQAICECIFYFR